MAVAALISCAVMTGGPASALGIRNCTDVDIRVNVYKGKDTVKLVPVRGGKGAIGRGKLYTFRLGKGGYQIRAYRSKKLTLPLLEKAGLRGDRVYSIRGRNGHYNVSSENGCPQQAQALIPANGIWVTRRDGKDHFIRIERRSPASFDVTYLPDGATHSFEQTDGDRYSNGYTADIKVQSETRIVMANHLLYGSEEIYRFVKR
jgi:hypothetical protein